MLISLFYFLSKYSENATSHNLHYLDVQFIFCFVYFLLQWVLCTFFVFEKLCENVVSIHIAQQKTTETSVHDFVGTK